jgi:hypothetical protein
VGEVGQDLIGGFVHTNGFGSSFHASTQAVTSASSSWTLRWLERRSLRLVSSANQRSTKFSQEL